MSTVHSPRGGGPPPAPQGRRPSRIVELEALEGAVSLTTLMDTLHRSGHRLPVHVAIYITHEVARALRRLHDSVDEQGHPLARVHGSVNGQSVLLLRSGRVRLVARGPMVDGDRHADLYMLGLAAWEMLVGWPPEGGAAGSRPVAPSALRPGLPDTVDAVVLRALDRNPRRRYPSAGSIAGDTARFLATRPDPRRGLRLLLHQVLAGDALGGDPTGVTRQTRVPWRDGSGALPPLPPPPPRSSVRVPPVPPPAPPPLPSAARPETTRLAPVATATLRAGELLHHRPWLNRLGVLVFQTVVAAILAGAALLALGLVRRPEPPPPLPPARGTVIVPIERPQIQQPPVQQPPVIIHVDRPRRHR